MSGLLFFFFNDTATTEIYTLSLHDALPIWAIHKVLCWHHDTPLNRLVPLRDPLFQRFWERVATRMLPRVLRSEEHTSELQSRLHLVCRLLLEKKKKRPVNHTFQQYN